jgi:hypothetical protein
MCEQADTFCRKTLTAFEHLAHLKVRMRADLSMMWEELRRKRAFYHPSGLVFLTAQ